MIYIHCQNLGLREEHINTLNILDAKAEHFSWLFKLSDKPETSDQYTVAVQLPDELADALLLEYVEQHTSGNLFCHLEEIHYVDQFRKMLREQLEYSVASFVNGKQFKMMPTGARMARDIQQTHLDDHEQAIFELLDAIDFPRWAEVEI
jgi:hypothetical protein